MDEKKFRDVEVRFKILSEQHKKGEINSDTLKKELKKMMILDEKSRYWMLGGKTGKWYVYNGQEWNEDNPYEQAVSQEEEPESFETRLFSKETNGSFMRAAAGDTGQTAQAGSSTIKIDATAAGQESDSQDADIVLTQEDRSDADLEIVSLQDDDGAAELEVVHTMDSDDAVAPDIISTQRDSYGDLEVVSTREEARASDFEVDLTGMNESTGHEVVLPREDGDVYDLEILSAQDDSDALAAETVDVSGEEEATVFATDMVDRAREDRRPVGIDAAREDIEKVPGGEVEIAPREAAPAKVAKKVQQIDELVISSIDMISLIFFLGGIGLIVGVLFGATFGIFTGVFGDLINYFPELLRDAQGGIAGGLIFAFIGGFGGTFLFAFAAVVISSFYNLIAFIFGGIRVKIK